MPSVIRIPSFLHVSLLLSGNFYFEILPSMLHHIRTGPRLQALSPVGRSKSFDATADGYGRGEGFLTATLARNSAELQGGIATILGAAVNHAGRSSGLTAPNGPAQTALVQAALAAGSTVPGKVGCVSVHGTGTPLGDPIEVGALAQAFQEPRDGGRTPRALVSNKACYGHTEGAAGLTGLLLASSVLSRSALPAIMHLRAINPYVQAALSDWGHKARSPAAVPRVLSPATPLAAVVGSSSFGMSGVNAHMLAGNDPVGLDNDSSGSDSSANQPSPVSWARERAWPLPPAFVLLGTADWYTAESAQFVTRLAVPALAFLCDHQVRMACSGLGTCSHCDITDSKTLVQASTMVHSLCRSRGGRCSLVRACSRPALPQPPPSLLGPPQPCCTACPSQLR